MWVQASCAHELKRKRRNTKLKVTQSPGGVFFFSRRFSWLQTNRAERPHPSWKAIFIPVWLHVLPRSTLIVSHSVEATKRQAFQNTQTITLFFCTQLKIIASSGFQSAALCVLHSLKLFWWVNSRRGKSKMAAERPDCLSHQEVSVTSVTAPLC